jgi:hypothetical protein
MTKIALPALPLELETPAEQWSEEQSTHYGKGLVDFPFLPGSNIHLVVDRLAYQSVPSGYDDLMLVGKIVAEESAMTINVPDQADYSEFLNPDSPVCIVEHSMNQLVGVKAKDLSGESTWSFVLKLASDLDLLWSPADFRIEVWADTLEPLPSSLDESDLSFVAPIRRIVVTPVRMPYEKGRIHRLR